MNYMKIMITGILTLLLFLLSCTTETKKQKEESSTTDVVMKDTNLVVYKKIIDSTFKLPPLKLNNTRIWNHSIASREVTQTLPFSKSKSTKLVVAGIVIGYFKTQ